MENNETPESSSKSTERIDSNNTGNVVDMMLGKSSEKVTNSEIMIQETQKEFGVH